MATDGLRRLAAVGAHLVPARTDLIRVRPDVAAALAAGRPVVALESTIVAHGMPWPDNLDTARQVEDAIRAGGAVPATIAILDGVPVVGLTAEELERLARLGPSAAKASGRDLAVLVARRATGATTVAGTMALAAAVGITVFVTGGIGGVHRGGEDSMDVSADLTALSRLPVCVVCAGAKSILDIPRTLEVLETLEVPVVAYGTDHFPAFFTPSSGVAAPARADTPADVARILAAMASLGRPGGIVVAVPLPPGPHTSAAAAVEAAVEAALAEAAVSGVKGAATTPFLLRRTAELSAGGSQRANVALVVNNARLGAAIAVAACALGGGQAPR